MGYAMFIISDLLVLIKMYQSNSNSLTNCVDSILSDQRVVILKNHYLNLSIKDTLRFTH